MIMGARRKMMKKFSFVAKVDECPKNSDFKKYEIVLAEAKEYMKK